MLVAEDLFIKGRHTELVPTTTLVAPSKTVTLVQADSALTRTALALALTGRMKPTSGTVTHGHSMSLAELRLHTGLIDAVDVNEPETHLKIIDLVNEDLALIPGKRRAKLTAAEWLNVNHLQRLSANWIDQVSPAERIILLAELARTDHAVNTLVFDTPDRHTPYTDEWLQPLQKFAERDTVVATVLNIPDNFEGPVFYVDNAIQAALDRAKTDPQKSTDLQRSPESQEPAEPTKTTETQESGDSK